MRGHYNFLFVLYCIVLLTAVAGYVTVTLMTFDKHSNGCRIVVVATALEKKVHGHRRRPPGDGDRSPPNLEWKGH